MFCFEPLEPYTSRDGDSGAHSTFTHVADGKDTTSESDMLRHGETRTNIDGLNRGEENPRKRWRRGSFMLEQLIQERCSATHILHGCPVDCRGRTLAELYMT